VACECIIIPCMQKSLIQTANPLVPLSLLAISFFHVEVGFAIQVFRIYRPCLVIVFFINIKAVVCVCVRACVRACVCSVEP